MNFIETKLKGVFIIEPKVWGDSRGYFLESYKKDLFSENIGSVEFIQDNESFSSYGVLRGLHYQIGQYAQAKLVRVMHGSVLDVAVDIRKSSPTFGQHVAVELTADNKRQLFIPRGFAHGFLVTSETALFCYKVDNVYAPQHERSIIYNDADIAINWQLELNNLKLSEKDLKAGLLKNAEIYE